MVGRDRAPKILVVDDDRDIRLVLGAILEGAGYETVEAANGLEALALVKAERPDVVLLDLSMPRMDGMEVLRHLRANPETAGIPVVMVTASGDQDQASMAVAGGAFAYVVKPWDTHEIERTVAAGLRMPGSHAT